MDPTDCQLFIQFSTGDDTAAVLARATESSAFRGLRASLRIVVVSYTEDQSRIPFLVTRRIIIRAQSVR